MGNDCTLLSTVQNVGLIGLKKKLRDGVCFFYLMVNIIFFKLSTE